MKGYFLSALMSDTDEKLSKLPEIHSLSVEDGRMFKLCKYLNVLRQVPKLCYQLLTSVLNIFGFVLPRSNRCILLNERTTGEVCILMYVGGMRFLFKQKDEKNLNMFLAKLPVMSYFEIFHHLKGITLEFTGHENLFLNYLLSRRLLNYPIWSN